MSEAPQKPTLGEELFMVHLSRMSDTPEDVDSEINLTHQPQTTLGESLWQVHLKRSAELREDSDEEGALERKRLTRKKSRSNNLNNNNVFAAEASCKVAEQTSPRQVASRTLNLRNRKVAIF